MKVSVLFLLAAAFVITEAAVSVIPSKNGKCESELTGFLKPGEVKNLKDCTQAVCSENGNIQIETCGTVAPPPNCKNVPDLSKPYPDCCVNIVCP